MSYHDFLFNYDIFTNNINFKLDSKVDKYLNYCKNAVKNWDYDISVKSLLKVMETLDDYLKYYHCYRLDNKGNKVFINDKNAKGNILETKIKYYENYGKGSTIDNYNFIKDFLDFNDLMRKAKISRFLKKENEVAFQQKNPWLGVKKVLAVDKYGEMLGVHEIDTWDGEEEGFYYEFFVKENKKEISDE